MKIKKTNNELFFCVAIVFAVFLASCGSSGGEEGGEEGGDDLTLSSPDFEDGEPLPAEAACEENGGTESEMTLAWENPPEGTEGFALVFIDEDADGEAAEEGFIHLVAYNIAPDVTSTGDAGFGEALFTTNDGGEIGYFPPCPPEGEAAHTYVATFYAVGTADLSEGLADPTDPDEVLAAIRANDIDSASISGTMAAP